jgi:hypothetical protein
MLSFWHLKLDCSEIFENKCTIGPVYVGVYRSRTERTKTGKEIPLEDGKKPCPDTRKISKSVNVISRN